MLGVCKRNKKQGKKAEKKRKKERKQLMQSKESGIIISRHPIQAIYQ